MFERFYGLFNQAGQGTPATGPESDAITRNLATLDVDSHPLYATHQDYDFVDTASGFPSLLDVPLYRALDYNGELPAAVQPTAVRPAPWLS